jgi:hypothetical protein
VERYNLAQVPSVFVADAAVKEAERTCSKLSRLGVNNLD